MSAEMESRLCTPSVIARLMGLDEFSPHQPVHKKQKVLSENYLLSVASVGIRRKRSSHERCVFRLIDEKKKEFESTFEVHRKLKREGHLNLPVEKGKFNLSFLSENEVGYARGVVDSKIDLFMKYLQEPDSLMTDHLCNLQGTPYQSCHSTILKSSNASHAGMTDMCIISARETDHESNKRLGEISQLTEAGKNTVLMKVAKSGCRDSDTLAKESYVDWEARKEILERPETTNNFQGVEAASGCSTLGEMLESDSGNLAFRLGEDAHSCQDGLRGNLIMRPVESAHRLNPRFRKQRHNQKEGPEHGCKIPEGRDVQEQKKQQQLAENDLPEQRSVLTKSSGDTDTETVVEGLSSENHELKHFAESGLLVKDGYFSSQVPYSCTQQDMSIGTFKEDYGSSFCSGIDPESFVNTEEAYQSSPNSVLEPQFEKEIISSSACFQGVYANFHDLQLQLELLNSESSETYSEGDGMIVSSDDDFDQGSISNAGESEQFLGTFSTEEGRDFSYLVDVFTEASFRDRNSGTSSFGTWHSL